MIKILTGIISYMLLCMVVSSKIRHLFNKNKLYASLSGSQATIGSNTVSSNINLYTNNDFNLSDKECLQVILKC